MMIGLGYKIMEPKISVLMPVCNGEKFLCECIESIIGQSFSDFEFIIVENGSGDNSWELINSFNDPRIKPIKSPIRQVAYNLNLALMNSSGKYIARMDSDDISYPRRFQVQFDFLEQNWDVAIAGSGFKCFGENVDEKIVFMPETDRAIRRKLPFRFCFCHPSVMFRRELVLNYGGYQGVNGCEDLDLWLRLSRSNSIKMANIPEVLLKYRIHPAQTKGKKDTYADVAMLMMREALLRKSPGYFMGFWVSLFKYLIK